MIAAIGCLPLFNSGSLYASGHDKDQRDKHDKDKKEKHEKDKEELQVLMCHTPTGNPADQVEIWVCSDDVQAHLAYGDYLGSCVAAPPDYCLACETAYTDCVNAAAGDPDVTPVCDAQRTTCLLACGWAPPPSNPCVDSCTLDCIACQAGAVSGPLFDYCLLLKAQCVATCPQ